MIKAEELRLGSIVTDQWWDSFKTIIKVESINNKGINLFIEDDGNYSEVAGRWIGPEYAFDKLCGIPLTPEILEKCGFICNNASMVFRKYTNKNDNECIYVSLINVGNNPKWRTEYAYKNEFAPHKKPIHYLHQLQNLFYSLAGEELTINL